MEGFGASIHKALNQLVMITLFTKNKYLIQTRRFDLLVDWAFYCIFVDSDPYIPHGEHAREEEVAEITIDTILKLAA